MNPSSHLCTATTPRTLHLSHHRPIFPSPSPSARSRAPQRLMSLCYRTDGQLPYTFNLLTRHRRGVVYIAVAELTFSRAFIYFGFLPVFSSQTYPPAFLYAQHTCNSLPHPLLSQSSSSFAFIPTSTLSNFPLLRFCRYRYLLLLMLTSFTYNVLLHDVRMYFNVPNESYSPYCID